MSEHDDPSPDEPEQIRLTRRMVDLSLEQTRLAQQRNEMSAERTYLNAERTLSVWVRTALAVMVVGIAVDRFGLFLHEQTGAVSTPDATSTGVGSALVALGVLMAVLTAARFWHYAATYRRSHAVPHHHGPFLAPLFAVLVAGFGVALCVLLVVSPD